MIEVRQGTDTHSGDVWVEAYVVIGRSESITYRRRVPYIATQGTDYPEILASAKEYAEVTLRKVLQNAGHPGY